MIDPELLKEEAERAALTPEVAKDLRLPELENVLALDTFHDQPQLVPVPQSQGELNHNTGAQRGEGRCESALELAPAGAAEG